MALLLHFPTPQDGADAYHTWLDNGNTGTFSDYLKAITGDAGAQGLSAYQVAVANGYLGTEAQWLNSLKVTGPAGKSAYQSAVDNGYSGTETQWAQQMTGIKTNITSVNPKTASITFVNGSWVRIGSMYTVSVLLRPTSTLRQGSFTLNIPGVPTIPNVKIAIPKPTTGGYVTGAMVIQNNGNEFYFDETTDVFGDIYILFSFIL